MSQAGSLDSSGGGGGGTVTSFSFTNANGFTGVVTNPTTTPDLTLSYSGVTGYSPATYVVSPNVGEGDFTTIAAALTASVSGDTIYIKEGTYAETLTGKAGVNLVGLTANGIQGNVSITGSFTFSAAGTCCISGIKFVGANLINVSGSAASILYIKDCNFSCTGLSTFDFSSSSSSSRLYVINCLGVLAVGGNRFFNHNSLGIIYVYNSYFQGAGTTYDNISGGSLYMYHSVFNHGMINVGGSFYIDFCHADASDRNMHPFYSNGGQPSYVTNSYIASGSQICVGVASGSTTYAYNNVCNASGNAIANFGGAVYSSGNNFLNSKTTVNTTGGCIEGKNDGAPAVGFVGQQIRSAVAVGSAVATTSTTITNITSVSLTAGVWDVSGIVMFTDMATATWQQGGISVANNTLPAVGDQTVNAAFLSTSAGDFGISIPSFRVTLTATTTYYLNGQGTYSSGTGALYGRISATRVG